MDPSDVYGAGGGGGVPRKARSTSIVPAANTKPVLSEKEQEKLNNRLLKFASGYRRILDDYSKKRRFKEIKEAIETGADPNVQDKHGRSVLLLASDIPEAVEYLVENGADIEAENEYGDTALICVANYWYVSVDKLEALIKCGANINHQNKKGITALIRACQSPGNLEAIKFLMDNGARLDSLDEGGLSTLHYAVLARKVEYVELILEGAGITNLDDQARDRLFNFAAATENAGIISMISNALGKVKKEAPVSCELGWSANGSGLVTYMTFDDNIGKGMMQMFNFAAGVVLTTMLDENRAPIGTTTQASIKDYERDAECFEYKHLQEARRHLKR